MDRVEQLIGGCEGEGDDEFPGGSETPCFRVSDANDVCVSCEDSGGRVAPGTVRRQDINSLACSEVAVKSSLSVDWKGKLPCWFCWSSGEDCTALDELSLSDWSQRHGAGQGIN